MKKQRVILALVAVILIGLWAASLWPQPTPINPATAPATPADKPAPGFTPEAFEQQVKKLTVAMEGGGVETSFILVDKSLGLNPTFARDCHPLLHRLGQAAYRHYGSFAAAMAPAKEICNSGYVHGVIEANFLNQPDVATALSSSCPDTQSTTYASWQCFHGAGHGVMYRLENDVRASLDACQSLAVDFASQSCANGVYMEAFNVVGHGGGHGGSKTNPGLSLCQTEPRYRTDCYFYAPVAYLTEHNSGYRAAVQWCQAVEDAHRASCIRGVGSQVMKDNITKPAIAAEVCAQAPERQREVCIEGAVGLAVNHHGKSEPAKALCDSTFKAYKAACMNRIADKQRAFGI